MKGKTLNIYKIYKQPTYKMFRVSDFIEDEYFRLWVNDPEYNPMLKIFWETWFTNDPPNIAAADEAKNILMAIKQNNENYIIEQKQDKVWKRVRHNIKGISKNPFVIGSDSEAISPFED